MTLCQTLNLKSCTFTISKMKFSEKSLSVHMSVPVLSFPRLSLSTKKFQSHTLEFQYLPRAGPKMFCALAHQGSTCFACTFQFYNVSISNSFDMFVNLSLVFLFLFKNYLYDGNIFMTILIYKKKESLFELFQKLTFHSCFEIAAFAAKTAI